MAETSIEWTATRGPDGKIYIGYTFNPWWGCTRVSPGCEHCYAEAFDHRLGRADWGAKAPRRFFDDAHWAQPLKWNARAQRLGVRLKVFCASMADVFEDRPDLVEPRARLYRLIRETPHLDWLLLTKRPENADRLWMQSHDAVAEHPNDWETWQVNVWLGTTVEDQRHAYERIPHLLRVPASVRFLSCEPLLGPLEFSDVTRRSDAVAQLGRKSLSGIHWIIVGGESGHGARMYDVAWSRSIIAQCKAAGVPVFHKQVGAFVVDRNDAGFEAEHEVWAEGPDAGRPTNPSAWPTPRDIEHDINGHREEYQGALVRIRLASKKGGDITEWPEDLRVREFPVQA